MKRILVILLLLNIGFTQELIPAITEFYDNGMPKEISYYQRVEKKIILTKTISYHSNGQIWIEKNYKDGELDGKWTLYDDKNGQIRREGNYKDGEWDGKWIWYYRNGQIEWEGNYKDGELDGKCTYYNEDGTIQKVENYKDGKLID